LDCIYIPKAEFKTGTSQTTVTAPVTTSGSITQNVVMSTVRTPRTNSTGAKEQVGPNDQSKSIASSSKPTSVPDEIGKLNVVVNKCDLMNSDVGEWAKPNCYIILELEENHAKKTGTIHKELNPVWIDSNAFDFVITKTNCHSKLIVTIMDYNDNQKEPDDFLGEVVIPLDPICKEARECPINLELSNTTDSKHKSSKETAKVSGKISLNLTYTPHSSDILNTASKQRLSEIPKSEFGNRKMAIENKIAELRTDIQKLDTELRNRISADGYKAASYMETVFFFFVKLFLIVWNLALILHITHLFLNS